MAWRGLHLTSSAHLSLRHAAICVARKGEPDITVPLEDIGWIILDTAQATLTTALLSACAKSDVLVLVSDERHLPIGSLTPLSGYHRQLTTRQDQIALTASYNKRVWRDCIRAKINNQAAVLRLCRPLNQKAMETADRLEKLAKRVQPGDPENLEGQAAQLYWPALFSGFTRRNDADGRNAFLNYAYAIIRACLARELAALGFETAMGIHHCNALNQHNLADDLIEPYRPLIDRQVFSVLTALSATEDPAVAFALEERRSLVGIPGEQLVMEGQSMSFLTAAGRSAAALRQSMAERDPKRMVFPACWMGGETEDLFDP